MSITIQNSGRGGRDAEDGGSLSFQEMANDNTINARGKVTSEKGKSRKKNGEEAVPFNWSGERTFLPEKATLSSKKKTSE